MAEESCQLVYRWASGRCGPTVEIQKLVPTVDPHAGPLRGRRTRRDRGFPPNGVGNIAVMQVAADLSMTYTTQPV